MARRARGSFWTRLAQQQARWLVRHAVRVGKQARKVQAARTPVKTNKARTVSKPGKAVAKATPPELPHGPGRTGMVMGVAGLRRYYLFQPSDLASGQLHPLIIMLHGCGQTAVDLAASTRMNRLAARYGFMVLYPEQDRLANAHGCWNWFDSRSGRAAREAASIVAVLDRVCTRYAVDPARVAIAGLSAGASMAARVALAAPDKFAAVVMHSGVEPTLAHSSATAVAAMRGRGRMPALPIGALPLALPAMLVIQGRADSVVFKINGMRAAQAWAARSQAQPQPARVVYRGNRYPLTRMDWRVGKRVQVRLCEVNGLGHAWSGGAASQAFSDSQGPDASRMVWAFAQAQW